MHSQTIRSHTTKYRQRHGHTSPLLLLCPLYTSLFIHPTPLLPSLTPHLLHSPLLSSPSSSTSLSPLLVQVVPPPPKAPTRLRIDCLAVLMLNMHRISHHLSSAPSTTPRSPFLALSLSPRLTPVICPLSFSYVVCVLAFTHA